MYIVYSVVDRKIKNKKHAYLVETMTVSKIKWQTCFMESNLYVNCRLCIIVFFTELVLIHIIDSGDSIHGQFLYNVEYTKTIFKTKQIRCGTEPFNNVIYIMRIAIWRNDLMLPSTVSYEYWWKEIIIIIIYYTIYTYMYTHEARAAAALGGKQRKYYYWNYAVLHFVIVKGLAKNVLCKFGETEFKVVRFFFLRWGFGCGLNRWAGEVTGWTTSVDA